MQVKDSGSNRFLICEEPEDLQISMSGLKLDLTDFKKAVRDEMSLPILAALVPLWITVLTTKFPEIGGVSPDKITKLAIVASTLPTVYVLWPALKRAFFILVAFVTWIFKSDLLVEWLLENEANPKKKAQRIRNKWAGSKDNN